MKRTVWVLTLLLSVCAFAVGQNDSGTTCPQVSILGPAGLTNPGGNMKFLVDSRDQSGTNWNYKWTISAGTIERGQNSQVIEVVLPSDLIFGNVTATVEITGLPAGCAAIFSETAGVAGCGLPIEADTFGRLPRNDELARLQNIAVQLENSPELTALFILGLSKKEDHHFADSTRLRLINGLHRLGVEEDRIKFVYSDTDEYHVRIYLLPKSAFLDFPDTVDDLSKIRPSRAVSKRKNNN